MINRVILMGRLVSDPELKTTAAGISVTTFRIAVDRDYVKKGGERQADFFDIVAWRSTAEFVCRNFTKGSLIAIDGQLQSRQYQTKAGENRTVIEAQADTVSFTGERREPVSELEYNLDDFSLSNGGMNVKRKSQPKRPAQQTMYTSDDDLPWE